jgi:radical SAM enzyme (TIGR01210 family)
MAAYPTSPAGRNRWVLGHRPARNVVDPWLPYAYFVEPELGAEGETVEVATVFLTNRECPWRCLMCDLWKNTLEESVPRGAITTQIRHALRHLPPLAPERSYLKLYNAGSFFDPRAIPPGDEPSIAELASPFRRTIVECHPALVGVRCLKFRDRIRGRLEVAMGLETAHPQILARLNKRMTLEQFRAAAGFLTGAGIDLRVFVLVRPPWLTEEEGLEWALRSLDFAFECGAAVCTLIPTRAGNGAMEALIESGEFTPPSLSSLEAAQAYGLSLRAGRVFVDLWDVSNLVRCPECSSSRIDRIRSMNATQVVGRRVLCPRCPDA